MKTTVKTLWPVLLRPTDEIPINALRQTSPIAQSILPKIKLWFSFEEEPVVGAGGVIDATGVNNLERTDAFAGELAGVRGFASSPANGSAYIRGDVSGNPDVAFTNESFTIGTCVRTDVEDRNSRGITSRWSTEADLRSYILLFQDAGKLEFGVSTAGTAGSVTSVVSDDAHNDANWRTVFCGRSTEGAGSISLDVDGVVKTAAFASGNTMFTGANRLVLHRIDTTVTYGGVGVVLDEHFIAQPELTAEEKAWIRAGAGGWRTYAEILAAAT